MASNRNIIIPVLSLAALLGMGYVIYSAFQEAAPRNQANSDQIKKLQAPLIHSPKHNRTSTQTTAQSKTPPTEDSTLHPIKEALLSFSSDEAYQNFLKRSVSLGFTTLGAIDSLRTVRVQFRDIQILDGIEGAEASPNYPVNIPAPPEVSAQDGALPFGNNALSAIGINQDNSDWGAGVTVAVIDSGVNSHLSLEDGVNQIELTELSAESEQLGHGTAVSSIISGNHPLTPGVAPASNILSVRVTDAFGNSDSFTLAQGILAAADAGAQIINISMGSTGNSSIVLQAVQYAQDLGAVIVASSGNEGTSQAAYPAAYDGVISVGAIEGNGDHVAFSNSSENLTLTAPGYQVNAAWGEDLLTSFSGTSASAPFVSGAIAAIMSTSPGLNAQQAANLLLDYTNEAGPIGLDPQYGSGTLDLGRVLERNTSDVHDIAVTSQYLTTNENGDTELNVIFQNQGTSSLFNSPAQITTPNGTTQLSINSLSPDQTHIARLPISTPESGETLTIYSSVSTSNTDIDLRNNSKQSNFRTENE